MTNAIYRQIDTNATFRKIAEEMLTYWKEEKIEEISLTKSLGAKEFSFLEGPPTANGRPHLGHAMTRTIKDTILRYKYMTGHNILGRSGGWDCHGLPVEIEAEKHFGINSKKEIENLGIEKFNKYCGESVFRYIEEWKSIDQMLGFWVNHNRDYVTLVPEYMESEWWAMKTLFDQGLLFKDYKILPYCPRCGTSLSSHEVSQGYEEVTDISIYVRFAVKDTKNTFLLAWTTTPWTLAANQFLAVNPESEYSLVNKDGESYYLASSLVDKLFPGATVERTGIKGRELSGIRYDQLLKFLVPFEGNLQVVTADFVSLDEGSGIVHISPAFGADDFEIGKRMKTKILNPVNGDGIYDDSSLPWKGLHVMEANSKIIDFLKKEKLLFKTEKIKHTYPFCYRCKSALIYYPIDAWFVGVSRKRKEILETNSKVNWYPSYLKEGRFGNFLEEAKDWSLSRTRYWGTPLPIWKCENGHYTAVGSVAELKKRSGTLLENLHRPFVDTVTFPCDNCGSPAKREPYVIDTWFDSGSATYAEDGYPYRAKETHVPVTFITEAIDQTRGWYYTMHVLSTLLFNSNAYNNVLTIEFVLDEKGRKMSKSEGNSVLARDAIEKNGPDPLRLFFFYGVPWKTRNYDTRLISELSRKVLSTMMNVYSFFSSNANIDNFVFSGVKDSADPLDRWILSRLNQTVKTCSERMEDYQPHEALRHLMEFIDQVSNTYLRLSRRKFWSESMVPEKEAAYSILYAVLRDTCLLLAPIVPFTSEYIYRALTSEKSVHLTRYPEFEGRGVDETLESNFAAVISLLETARRMRQKASIKGRQPLTELLISAKTSLEVNLLDIVKSELNCKKIEIVEPGKEPLESRLRLNFKVAAPILKEKLTPFAMKIESLDSGTLLNQLDKEGYITVENTRISSEMLTVEHVVKEPYVMDTDEKTGNILFLNTKIDAELAIEGISREVIRRIQVMRKDLDLDYEDRISVVLEADDEIVQAVKDRLKPIATETLADSLSFGAASGAREWEIAGSKVKIFVAKAEMAE